MKRFPRSTEVQSLLFDKSAFNVTRAKEWAKAHGYRTSGTDIGGDRATKIRLRQRDPEEFAKGTFRTIEFEPGIEAVIAMPKKAPVTRRNPADGFPPIRAGESSVSYGVRYATAQTGYTGEAAAYAAGVAKGNAWHKAYYAAIDHHRALKDAPETGPHTPTLRLGEAHPSWDAELSGRDPLLHPSFHGPRRNPADGAKRPTRTSQVDAYLAAHGFPGVRLYRSARDAYCYFYGDEVDDWDGTGVMVPRVSDLSLDQWLAEARRLSATARQNPALRKNPGGQTEWRERLRSLELAIRVRKVPKADQQSAALISLALQFVPATDHLWTRPPPSSAPGSASNSDIVVALRSHGKGHEADVATGRAAPRDFDPVALARAGIGAGPRRNPSTSLGSYGEIRTRKPLNAAAKRVVQSFIAGDNSYSDLHAYLSEHGFGPEALHSPARVAEARQGVRTLRKNPMTADLASMDFAEFCKHVVIGKGYNTLSGRRFVRVHSRDNAVMTDVPVSDGDGGKVLKRAADIKRRAYDQLRVHLVPGQTLADRAKRRRNPAMPDYDVVYRNAQGQWVREAVKTQTTPPRGSWGTSVYITESGVRVPHIDAMLIGPIERRRR